MRLAAAAQHYFDEDADLFDDFVAEAWNEWTITVTGTVRCFGTPSSEKLEVSIFEAHNDPNCDASGDCVEVVRVEYTKAGGAK